MNNLHVIDHPLVCDSLTIMRDETTPSAEFRARLDKIAAILTYEATRDLGLRSEEIVTPVCEAMLPVLDGSPITVVPILRAGLGMLNGFLEMVPDASVGFIGMERDEETFEAREYYAKMPLTVAESKVYVIDPMLATGGSAIDAITNLKARGARDIRFVCIVAAPVGVAALQEAHPDVEIYTAALDEGLNDHAYIVPGLGDAGDRIFGTTHN